MGGTWLHDQSGGLPDLSVSLPGLSGAFMACQENFPTFREHFPACLEKISGIEAGSRAVWAPNSSEVLVNLDSGQVQSGAFPDLFWCVKLCLFYFRLWLFEDMTELSWMYQVQSFYCFLIGQFIFSLFGKFGNQLCIFTPDPKVRNDLLQTAPVEHPH